MRRSDEVSVFNEQMDERFAMDKRMRTIVILGVLVVVLVPAFTLMPTGFLTATGLQKGPAWYFELLGSNLTALGNWISGIPDGNGLRVVFWQTLTVALIGAALAINGAVYQGAMKNALASPSTLGVMSGGTLGAVIYTLAYNVPEEGVSVTVVQSSDLAAQLQSMSTLEYIWATQSRALFSIAGCFIVVMLVLLIALVAGRGKVSKTGLVIAGQVFAAVISGVVNIVRTWIAANGTEEQLYALQNMVNGSVSNVMGPLQFSLIAIPLVAGFAVIMFMRGRLNLLAFNDEEAKSMGLSVNRTRNVMIGVCTIMTAVVVSFCGSVGFVGFLIPHLTRKLVGPDLRYMIPAAALLGSVYLLIANYVMNVGAIMQGALGSFTTFVGIIFFLVAAIGQRKSGNADWI